MALSNSACAHLAIVLSIVTDSYVLLSAQAYLLLRYLPHRLPRKHAEGSELPQHSHAAKYNFNQICSTGDPTETVSAQKCDINVKFCEDKWGDSDAVRTALQARGRTVIEIVISWSLRDRLHL